MGMFDNVQVEFELEDCANPELENWQTKDFHCALDTYVLTHSGHIVGPDGLMDYSGSVNFYSYENNVWLEYTATYEQGILQSVEKINGRC
jgi:hypothetical protein